MRHTDALGLHRMVLRIVELSHLFVVEVGHSIFAAHCNYYSSAAIDSQLVIRQFRETLHREVSIIRLVGNLVSSERGIACAYLAIALGTSNGMNVDIRGRL